MFFFSTALNDFHLSYTAANAKVANSSLLIHSVPPPQSFELACLVLRILILAHKAGKVGKRIFIQKIHKDFGKI